MFQFKYFILFTADQKIIFFYVPNMVLNEISIVSFISILHTIPILG